MTKCDKCKDPDYLETIFEHCQLDPETQAWERRVAYFFKVYPGIIGLSYSAADLLRRETNLKIRNAAISIIRDEIKRRGSIESKDYSISRRQVTADQVRSILNESRIAIDGTQLQRDNLKKRKSEEEKESVFICPFFQNLSEDEKKGYECKGVVSKTVTKRDKIVSLRVVEDLDNALSYLAKRLDVSRSLLVSEIIAIKAKFPEAVL